MFRINSVWYDQRSFSFFKISIQFNYFRLISHRHRTSCFTDVIYLLIYLPSMGATAIMPLIHLLIAALHKLFTYLLSSLLIYFLKNRPVSFPGRRRPNLALVFGFILCCGHLVYFVTDACLLLLC